ncbi:MAG: glycosyl transferase family 2 [Solirubrobacterales bacterium]|jgi:GT2 family glycosyltransferase|nr:glycosyl transferase family 2 [Solirubrobacterales bacterium]
MAASGFNAVRTYTVPPRWLLDLAADHGLFVMVGLPWEQHIPFLDDRDRARSIEERIRAGVAACTGHPAVLSYAIGNEIRAPIVRWHGPRAVERFLEQLYAAAKDEDPDGLVTYVNYPSTEYLELPFLDIVCFNVYLEAKRTLEAYIARLHNLSGDRPLILAEIGLDSRRNGEEQQARTLDWQVRSTFASGCAGAFVFAWTDEWHMHQAGPEMDFAVEDWDFGLTDRGRRPKPALAAVADAFSEAPLSTDTSWPRISVLVCTHNGARTLPDCLAGLEALEYPDFEVIVVSDGSTDATAEIVHRHGFALIRGERMGLAAARNAGLEASTGEIVAYIDDDARPDPHWLTYLADSFRRWPWAGVGGPNLPPHGDGSVAEAVANAPGGPIHVLVSDQEAEHIPGCNMAFRRTALEAIGGFDPIFRAAGDDVDVCWRLQDRGWKIGFNPAAVVWHRRRDSVGGYWRQQRGYGQAEALVERKWPERYNGAGHLTWSGRMYHPVTESPSVRRRRIRYGKWGSGLFQSVYERKSGILAALPLMPEWYLAIVGLALLTALGAFWAPLLLISAALALAVGSTLTQAGLAASRVVLPATERFSIEPMRIRTTVATLYLLQPAARLLGRIRGGLAPWRMRRGATLRVPRPRRAALWSESWRAPEERIRDLETAIKEGGGSVVHGGSFDRWDLEVRWGALGSARLLMAIEEYPEGKQYVRWRSWPRFSLHGVLGAVACAALALGAASDGAPVAAAVLAAIAVALLARTLRDAAAAMGSIVRSLDASRPSPRDADTVATRRAREDDHVGEPAHP